MTALGREAQSASSISLFLRCPRAYAYAYLDGLREPEVPWDEIEKGAPATSRQRSFSLGSATHHALEAWYRGEPYDWSRLPGVIADTGKPNLPHPETCEWIEVEGELLVENEQPLIVDGVKWAGRLDLTAAPAAAELQRLGITPVSPFVLIDHKTSSNINRYAPSPEELAAGLQPNLYGLALMHRFDLRVLTARWNYMQTGRTRKARPVDFVLERGRAEDLVGRASEAAHYANSIPTSADAPCNTAACGDYGGCQYHRNAGGPCDARRSAGALIQARVKKQEDKPMTMSPEIKAKLEKFRKKAQPETEPEPEAEEPEAEEPEAEEPEAEEPEAEEPEAEPEPEAEEPETEPEPAPRKRGRPKKKKPVASAKKAPAAAKTAAVKPPATAKTTAVTSDGSIAELARNYEDAMAMAEEAKAALLTKLGGE